MNFKIFGDRVLVKEADEKEREVGGIVLPESASRSYLMVEVVEVGDGRLRGMDGVVQRRICVKPGDRVLIQANPMMATNNMQKIGNERFLVLNHHDIIAKIDKDLYELSIATFNPVGRWVLLRVEKPEKVGTIYLPNQAQPLQSAGEVKTYLAKCGEVAEEELGILRGTRVMVEHSRVSPLHLNRVLCAYVDVASIAGAMPGEVSLDYLE